MSIVTLAEAKAQLNIDAADSRDDAELADYLDALTPVIERETGLVIQPRDCVDEIEVCEARTVTLSCVPVIELTSVARLDGDTYAWDLTTLHLNTATGKLRTFVCPSFTGMLSIAYTAGFPVDVDGNPIVPGNIKRGALVILQHTWELQRGVGNVAAAQVSTDGWAPTQGFLVPNRAKEWLGAPMPSVP